ncbi:unnamed protein product [Amoebophrya sp. A120]|nr:unnamed protein product [Amoebophrya sp. A120]|eukprot:GSA120T00003429001.1
MVKALQFFTVAKVATVTAVAPASQHRATAHIKAGKSHAKKERRTSAKARDQKSAAVTSIAFSEVGGKTKTQEDDPCKKFDENSPDNVKNFLQSLGIDASNDEEKVDFHGQSGQDLVKVMVEMSDQDYRYIQQTLINKEDEKMSGRVKDITVTDIETAIRDGARMGLSQHSMDKILFKEGQNTPAVVTAISDFINSEGPEKLLQGFEIMLGEEAANAMDVVNMDGVLGMAKNFFSDDTVATKLSKAVSALENTAIVGEVMNQVKQAVLIQTEKAKTLSPTSVIQEAYIDGAVSFAQVLDFSKNTELHENVLMFVDVVEGNECNDENGSPKKEIFTGATCVELQGVMQNVLGVGKALDEALGGIVSANLLLGESGLQYPPFGSPVADVLAGLVDKETDKLLLENTQVNQNIVNMQVGNLAQDMLTATLGKEFDTVKAAVKGAVPAMGAIFQVVEDLGLDKMLLRTLPKLLRMGFDAMFEYGPSWMRAMVQNLGGFSGAVDLFFKTAELLSPKVWPQLMGGLQRLFSGELLQDMECSLEVLRKTLYVEMGWHFYPADDTANKVPCQEVGVQYAHLAMPDPDNTNQELLATTEHDWWACREKCANFQHMHNKGTKCTYFSFWNVERRCYLQNADARMAWNNAQGWVTGVTDGIVEGEVNPSLSRRYSSIKTKSSSLLEGVDFGLLGHLHHSFGEWNSHTGWVPKDDDGTDGVSGITLLDEELLESAKGSGKTGAIYHPWMVIDLEEPMVVLGVQIQRRAATDLENGNEYVSIVRVSTSMTEPIFPPVNAGLGAWGNQLRPSQAVNTAMQTDVLSDAEAEREKKFGDASSFLQREEAEEEELHEVVQQMLQSSNDTLASREQLVRKIQELEHSRNAATEREDPSVLLQLHGTSGASLLQAEKKNAQQGDAQVEVLTAGSFKNDGTTLELSPYKIGNLDSNLWWTGDDIDKHGWADVRFKQHVVARYVKIFAVQCNNHCSMRARVRVMKRDGCFLQNFYTVDGHWVREEKGYQLDGIAAVAGTQEVRDHLQGKKADGSVLEFSSPDVASASPMSCQQACQATEGCEYFTWFGEPGLTSYDKSFFEPAKCYFMGRDAAILPLWGRLASPKMTKIQGVDWLGQSKSVTGSKYCRSARDGLHLQTSNLRERVIMNNPRECQKFCLDMPGCDFFSFWADGGCHVYGRSAIKVKNTYEAAEVYSGPAQCDGDKIAPEFQKETCDLTANADSQRAVTGGPLGNHGCYEPGVRYGGGNQGDSVGSFEDGVGYQYGTSVISDIYAGSAEECQLRCASTPKCYFFTFHSMLPGYCHLQTYDAQRVVWNAKALEEARTAAENGDTSAAWYVSGTRVCRHYEDFSFTEHNTNGKPEVGEGKCQWLEAFDLSITCEDLNGDDVWFTDSSFAEITAAAAKCKDTPEDAEKKTKCEKLCLLTDHCDAYWFDDASSSCKVYKDCSAKLSDSSATTDGTAGKTYRLDLSFHVGSMTLPDGCVQPRIPAGHLTTLKKVEVDDKQGGSDGGGESSQNGNGTLSNMTLSGGANATADDGSLCCSFTEMKHDAVGAESFADTAATTPDVEPEEAATVLV